MQIIGNSSSPLLTTLPTSPTKEILAPDLPVAPTSTSSPATIVNFSLPKDATDTYLQPTLVNVIQMSNLRDTGEAAKTIIQKLGADATNLRTYKSPLSVSNIFSQIGALSRETSSYKNAAHSYQATDTKANEKLKLNFSDTNGKPQQTVTLSIHTKDGDTVDIKIQHSRGTIGDNLEFSFEVKGKLSTEEQDALKKLTDKLGQVADDFFSTGTTELHGLKEFDQTNLKDFHIEFSKIKTADTYSTLSYDFSVDAKSQHLRAKDSDGYSLDVSADLQDVLGSANTSFNTSLENYLDIIRKTLNGYQPLQQEHSNRASMNFILDGLTSLLSINVNKEELLLASQTEKVLDAFDTGLPDFTATINGPLYMYRKPEQKLVIPESMSLKLSQHTETATQANGDLVAQQINSYERQSRQITGIVGSEKGDLTTGNFRYKTVHEKQETSRILNLGQDGIQNMVNDRTYSKETNIETYLDFHPVDHQQAEDYQHTFKQLVDEVEKHKYLKQAFNRIDYLTMSHANLFQ